MQAQRTPPKKLTADEYWDRLGEFPDTELIDGEVYPVSPTRPGHSEIESIIDFELRTWVKARGSGTVRCGEAGYELTPGVVRGADVAVHLVKPSPKPRWETEPADLIVEVVSLNDTWPDIEDKVGQWLGSGVREVWVVEPRSAVVKVCSKRGDVRFTRDQTLASEVLPGFALPLVKVFEV